MTMQQSLEDHYASEGIRERLDRALEQAGLGAGPIQWQQLAQLDQFHSRGLEAVKELAAVLEVKAEDTVLDLGSGLGGPARYLAATVGCQVMGVELTEEYVEMAQYLSERTGLADRTRFVQGDAADLKFADQSFDHAWTIHVSMNIADKAGFYAGVHRVLRQGGRFAMYDVLRGEVEPAIYPAPWSPVPELSFLASLAETQQLLAEAGFTEVLIADDSARALEGLTALLSAPPPDPNGPKVVSLPQVIGPQVRPMVMNLTQNLREGRTRVIRALVRKD